ncbi:MAG: hypothetical protein K0V04_24320 [Deltaproteobacteria bacterium]|nr:hypothetical protein [Deltaproteobacteria bacterium]
MFLLVSGGSGAGKSTCLAALHGRWPSVVVHEDDERPPPPDGAGRRVLLETFVAEAVTDARAGRVTLFGAQSTLGELLSCPSAPSVGPIAACLLDCHDVERGRRVRARQPDDHGWFGQDHLNWAAFHRMHAADPTWEPGVVIDDHEDGRWTGWTRWPRDDPRWHVHVIDTTTATPDQMTEQLATWVQALLDDPRRAPLRDDWRR